LTPAALVLFMTFTGGGASAIAIDMPTMEICVREQQKLLECCTQDTIARCVDRRN